MASLDDAGDQVIDEAVFGASQRGEVKAGRL
jgi:hypothetical protein